MHGLVHEGTNLVWDQLPLLSPIRECLLSLTFRLFTAQKNGEDEWYPAPERSSPAYAQDIHSIGKVIPELSTATHLQTVHETLVSPLPLLLRALERKTSPDGREVT